MDEQSGHRRKESRLSSLLVLKQLNHLTRNGIAKNESSGLSDSPYHSLSKVLPIDVSIDCI